MKLIALVTIVGAADKDVPPGESFEIADKREAESLVARGLAAKPATKARTKDEPATDGDAGTGGDTGTGGDSGNDGTPAA